MSNVTPIEKKSPRLEFDDIYHKLLLAVGDVKAVANLLTAVDGNEFDVNPVGYAQERMIERVEDIVSELWKFKPNH